MFADKTKTLVKNLGAQGDLIYKENVNENIEMMTLVKVREKTFWPVIKYTITDQKLLDLLEEPDYCPGVYSDTHTGKQVNKVTH